MSEVRQELKIFVKPWLEEQGSSDPVVASRGIYHEETGEIWINNLNGLGEDERQFTHTLLHEILHHIDAKHLGDKLDHDLLDEIAKHLAEEIRAVRVCTVEQNGCRECKSAHEMLRAALSVDPEITPEQVREAVDGYRWRDTEKDPMPFDEPCIMLFRYVDRSTGKVTMDIKIRLRPGPDGHTDWDGGSMLMDDEGDFPGELYEEASGWMPVPAYEAIKGER